GVRTPRKPVTVVRPEIRSHSAVVVPRDRPLDIELAGDANHAAVDLSINSVDDQGLNVSFYLHCPIDLVDGKGSVSKDALSVLPAGTAGAGISIDPANASWTESGAWIVGFLARTGERFEAPVSFE